MYLMDKSEIIERIRSISAAVGDVDLANVFVSFLQLDDFHDIGVAIHLSEEPEPINISSHLISQNSLKRPATYREALHLLAQGRHNCRRSG